MSLQKRYNKIFSLRKKYYIIISVICILLLIGIFAGYKIFIQKPTYIYIKIKVNQGLWWAITEKPPFWYMRAIQKGDTAYDFSGNSEAQILNKKAYLWSKSDLYDIYLILKLKVNKQAASYVYNRSVVSVGAPLEVQFPKETVSGTVIALSEYMFHEPLVEKTIYLEKRNAYPWEYDAVKIGDIVSDGNNAVFSVLDKSMIETTNLTTDAYGNNTANTSETKGYIRIKAKAKLKKISNSYILGEEKIIIPGRSLDLSLSSFSLKDFVVSKIE